MKTIAIVSQKGGVGKRLPPSISGLPPTKLGSRQQLLTSTHKAQLRNGAIGVM